MRSLQIYDLLRHHEERPNVSELRLRHPMIVTFHLAYICLIGMVYTQFSTKTSGQNLYFMVMIGLYLSSAAYHTWRPNSTLRFIDQTMIGWYVHILPYPLIYHEPWALPLTLSLMAMTAISKWYDWEGKLANQIDWLIPEKHYLIGAITFFLFGALSFGLVITYGFSAINVELVSITTFWLLLATVCFIGKLYFYTSRKGELIKNVWETPESGHFSLAQGNNIYMILVILYAV